MATSAQPMSPLQRNATLERWEAGSARLLARHAAASASTSVGEVVVALHDMVIADTASTAWSSRTSCAETSRRTAMWMISG